MELPNWRLPVLCLFICSCEPATPPETQISALPNIILLMGDDHSWEETGYNGHPYLLTPVLDEMAASGLVLDQFHAATPFCSPTRGSIITGRHPNRYGTFTPGWSIRPEEISIAQLLVQAGYTTAHFGKWHLGPVKSNSPTNPGAMGFQRWVSHDNFFEMDPVLSKNGAHPIKMPGEGSEVIVDETIRFVEQATSENQPFFAVVWFGSPHEPYSGLDQDLDLYHNLPDSINEVTVRLTSMETGKQVERPLGEVLQERFAEITAMDRAIGKLRDSLTSYGIRENTIFWYCGDNGIPPSGVYNNPFRGRKGMVYQGGLRVPSIIEWPQGLPKARVTDVNTVTSDIFNTLCEVTGQTPPKRPLDGISLLPLIKGEMVSRPDPIFFWNYEIQHELEYNREPYIETPLQEGTTPLVKMMGGLYTRNFRNFHHPDIQDSDFDGPRAILDNQYKLVINGDAQAPGIELFDVSKDPQEQNNLAEIYPEVVEKMEAQLIQWQQSVLHSLTGADY